MLFSGDLITEDSFEKCISEVVFELVLQGEFEEDIFVAAVLREAEWDHDAENQSGVDDLRCQFLVIQLGFYVI